MRSVRYSKLLESETHFVPSAWASVVISIELSTSNAASLISGFRVRNSRNARSIPSRSLKPNRNSTMSLSRCDNVNDAALALPSTPSKYSPTSVPTTSIAMVRKVMP